MHPLLLDRLHELRDLSGVIGLATWDQETYLPPRGQPARADQLGTLQGLYHERLIDPRLGEWLDAAAAASGLEARAVALLRKERDRAVKLPTALVKALAEAQSHGLAAWREARAQGSFATFRPALERLIALRLEQADAWGHDGERYDALLEGYEPGMRVARLVPVLDSLAARLQPLVATLTALPPPADPFAGQRWDVEAQWRFTLEVLTAMGFDLEAGRQDRSVHPFTGGAHPRDVRLTTRLFEALPLSSVFSTIHEGGHGLYEQGLDEAHFRTPLAQAPSMGLHESQSRLWENLVGRSRPFWQHFLPRWKAAMGAPAAGVELDAFLRAANRVERSFIRVEADEVTYNLHIVLRTRLEVALCRGALAVRDLEEAWNQQTRDLLGLEVTRPQDGVLQDIHWAWGELGYFPTYALGNLYASSLLRAARRDLPTLDAELARGHLLPLREWLRQKVHRQGYLFDAEELVRQVTGEGLTDGPFLEDVKARYGELYGVKL